MDKNLYPGLIICWSAGFASGEIKKEPGYAVVSAGKTVCLRGCERGGGEYLLRRESLVRYGVRLELLCWSGVKVRCCALAGGETVGMKVSIYYI